MKNAQNRAKRMALLIFLILATSGCANTPQIQPQIITKAMVITPPKPTPPNPETADQRAVAVYIVQLRGWGNAMAIQLENIRNLISE